MVRIKGLGLWILPQMDLTPKSKRGCLFNLSIKIMLTVFVSELKFTISVDLSFTIVCSERIEYLSRLPSSYLVLVGKNVFLLLVVKHEIWISLKHLKVGFLSSD